MTNSEKMLAVCRAVVAKKPCWPDGWNGVACQFCEAAIDMPSFDNYENADEANDMQRWLEKAPKQLKHDEGCEWVFACELVQI